MMKKVLLFSILSLFFYNAVNAQCTPDSSYTQPGFYPSEKANADTITIYEFYEKVITVVAFVDTTFNNQLITVDSAVFGGIDNLPNSIAFNCHNENCHIYGGGRGCIRFAGIPDSADMGLHTIKIKLDVYGLLMGNPTIYPLEHEFKLYIADTNGMVPLDTNNKEDSTTTVIADLEVSENIEIHFDSDRQQYIAQCKSDKNNIGRIQCYNILGRKMIDKEFSSSDNDIHVVSSDSWPKGVYIIRVQVGEASLVKKIMIQ